MGMLKVILCGSVSALILTCVDAALPSVKGSAQGGIDAPIRRMRLKEAEAHILSDDIGDSFPGRSPQKKQRHNERNMSDDLRSRRIGRWSLGAERGGWSVQTVKVHPHASVATTVWLGPLRASCVLLTILLQLSPMRPVLEIRRKGDVLRYDGFPFFTVLAGSLQWCIYGASAAVLNRDWAPFTLVESNGPGVIFGIFYVTVYCRNLRVDDERRRSMMRYIAAGVSLLAVEVLSLATFGRKAIFWFGFLGAALGTLVAVAPFKTFPEVLRTRSTESLPTELIAMCFIQSCVAGYFGFCIHDKWILVPNIAGLIAAGIQLLVICAIGQPPKHVDELAKAVQPA